MKILRRLMSLSLHHSLHLSEIAEFATRIPGTNTKDVKQETVRRYRDAAQKLIEFFGDDIYVESITRQQYADYHDWLATRGTKNITVNGYRHRSRAVWNRLRERGIDVCNIEGITQNLPVERKSKAMTDRHLYDILKVANVRDTAVILYTLSAGFRSQTIVRLTTAETFIWLTEKGEFRIASKIPREKTSPPRLVMGDHRAALAAKLWLETREHKDSPWLFNNTRTGGQLTGLTWVKMMQKIRKRANIPGYVNCSTHALRHRFAQDRLTEYDEKIVAQWMGISLETMLTVYAHRDTERLITERYGDSNFPVDLLSL